MARSAADRLHDDIMKILNEYVDEVDRTSEECVRKVSQKGALALRRVSPRRKRNGGTYASGWTYKVIRKRLKTFSILYNRKRPGLAHLLEHGHVTRNGTGRTYPRTPAHVHIKPIEDQLVREFERQIKVSLK